MSIDGLDMGEVSLSQLTIDQEEVVLVVGLTREGSVPSIANGGDGAGVDGRKWFMVTLLSLLGQGKVISIRMSRVLSIFLNAGGLDHHYTCVATPRQDASAYGPLESHGEDHQPTLV
jgi:hypothetical protein